MKILHIIPYEKFTEPYLEFINNNFEVKEHFFIVYGDSKQFKTISCDNLVSFNKDIKSIVYTIICMHNAKKIILHSLFSNEIKILLFFQPWLLKKCYWTVWGADLYCYTNRYRNIKSTINEIIRRFVIKNMAGICTLAKGDYNLAKKWYNVKGKYYHAVYINPIRIEYLDNVYNSNNLSYQTINIQIGNSADSANNHIEALDLLYAYKNENIMIYAPISYGDTEYAKEIVEYGKELFGKKFVGMTDFLSPEEYSSYLGKIDIAVFANERQQALGNIYALIYLEKKVYIRKDVSTWEYMQEQLNVNVFDYLDIKNQNFKEFISFDDKSRNKLNIMKVMDEKENKKIWSVIFRDDMVN